MSSLGLVLSGGGARGAYQAGVINALAEISRQEGIAYPFSYYTGVSAGAINTAFLTTADNCHIGNATAKLTELWTGISAEQVYVSDIFSLSKGGIQWLLDLSLGGMKKSSPHRSLLETKPLHELIRKNCDFNNIQKNIDAKRFRAVAISALDYFTTSTVTFIQGEEKTPTWTRVRKVGIAGKITADHVIASASIPLLFPPTTVDGRFFGDGSIRNQSPCAPAIYMGARKLIAIGVRKKQDVCFASRHVNTHEAPSIARVVSVILNTVMMDGLEADIERLERININLQKISASELENVSVKPVKYLWISPSVDLGEVASMKTENLPPMIRYLLRGLGTLQEASEIASFLLFEKSYSADLIQIGYKDGMNAREQVVRLLHDD
ncbi:patatin-like phospholipase family protein [Bdellovibrio bacteriovorus]|uniref:patatin-like phospholipase family protein n=1 Tax=Bdellovibrio bacteriovorus TaxID=959 RepID=UPI003AA7D1FC